MAKMLKDRLEIICKEASLLISNPPTKEIALATTSKGTNAVTLEADKLEILQAQIRTFTRSAAIHGGTNHGTSNTRTNIDFPEPLLCILWLHRWSIADKETMNNFKLLLRSDISFEWVQRTSIDFYNPIWIRYNIINPVVRTMQLLTTKGKKYHKARYKSFSKLSSRMQAAITHNITADIVKALLKYGPDPVYLIEDSNQSNSHTLQFITLELRENLKLLKDPNIKKKKDFFLPTTITELILSSIPRFFEIYFEEDDTSTIDLYTSVLVKHPKQKEKKKTAWENGTTWDKFKIRVPIVVKFIPPTSIPSGATKMSPIIGNIKKAPCSIDELFQYVLTGAIPPHYLFDEKTEKSTREKDAEEEDKEETTKKSSVNKKMAKEKLTEIIAIVDTIGQNRTRENLVTKINELRLLAGLE